MLLFFFFIFKLSLFSIPHLTLTHVTSVSSPHISSSSPFFVHSLSNSYLLLFFLIKNINSLPLFYYLHFTSVLSIYFSFFLHFVLFNTSISFFISIGPLVSTVLCEMITSVPVCERCLQVYIYIHIYINIYINTHCRKVFVFTKLFFLFFGFFFLRNCSLSCLITLIFFVSFHHLIILTNCMYS